MPRLRVVSGKKLIRIFEQFGFSVVSQRGSHVKMERTVLVVQTLIIPFHQSIAKGTLREIYIQASLHIPEKELRKHFYS